MRCGWCGWLVSSHDDVIKWKHFPRYWPFVRGIHRSPVNSPHKGQWRGALMFSLICVWINGWVNNREAGDLRHYRVHYDVTVMACEVWSQHRLGDIYMSSAFWVYCNTLWDHVTSGNCHRFSDVTHGSLQSRFQRRMWKSLAWTDQGGKISSSLITRETQLFNTKMPLYQHRESYCWYKTIFDRRSDLHDGISHTGKTSLHWIMTQLILKQHIWWCKHKSRGIYKTPCPSEVSVTLWLFLKHTSRK